MAGDVGEPTRALEYVNYADAALGRIGRPPDTMALFEYARGTALIQVDRFADGEAAVRRAFRLAETHRPQCVWRVIQGRAYLYQREGRFADAVDMYRRALADIAAHDQGAPELITREQLAISLELIGRSQEAVAEARRAVALADRTFGNDNIDRAIAHVDL